MRSSRVAGALCAAALAVTSCSTTTESAEPTQVTVTSRLTTVAPTPTPASATSPVSSSSASSTAAAAQEQSTTANFNGQAVTICAVGDGWGISELAVNANTSCPFAHNVIAELTSGVSSLENIRDYLPKTVTAHSPTTGKSYSMDCADNGVGIVTCTGADNAQVIFH